MYTTIFLVTWAIGVILYFKVRFTMKRLCPELHNEVFGKSWQDHSIGTSLKFLSFSLKTSEWSAITDESLLFWLKLNRWVSYLFLSYFVVFFVYFTISAIQLAGK